MTEQFNELEQQFNDLMKQGQELIEKIKQQEQQEKKPVKRWRADGDERYWFINDCNAVTYTTDNSPTDNFRYSIGNYFQTKEEAEDYKDRLLVHQELKDIALELNEGKEPNWENVYQNKFIIVFDGDKIAQCTFNIVRDININCLSRDFKTVAIERIGEDRLKNYLIKGV